MKKQLIIIICFFTSFANSQIEFYEDVFHGGVTGNGFNPFVLEHTGQIDVHIEPGSVIRKAYLFVSTARESTLLGLSNNSINFNGNNLPLRWSDVLGNYFTITPSSTSNYVNDLLAFDVTGYINPNSNSYYLIPAQNQLNTSLFHNYYLLIYYENSNLPLVGAKIVLNNQNAQQTLNYQVTLDADISNPVGFTFNSYAFCNTVFDGSYIIVNGNNIGLVGGDEPEDIHSCSGVRGAFYYQNNQLFGLANDTPTPSMAETDALASIENYIQDPTNLNIQFEYQTPNIVDNKTNPVHQLFFAYSPTCQPFDVTVPNDTTVCYGSQVQLNATGGSSTGSLPAYEWSPATGLSCTTCPNPIFTADSSMFYTVRIRNNDSCSVVRPVKINVRPIPSINAISTVATECGSSTGSLTASSSGSIGSPFAMQDLYVVTENGDTLSATSQNQQSATISNLGAGNYTVFYTDQNGCVSLDTVVTIISVNNTVANFTVSPQSGGAPLTVHVNNGSQNATDFEWFTSTGLSHQGTVPPAYVFDSSGTYQIMLVAWQHDPACADTAYVSVWVYDSLIVHIPNVFSPNSDGINDFFSITVNQPVKAKLQIVNRWGNEVFSFDGLLNVGATNLWDGTSAGKVTDGVYFYTLTVDLMTNDMMTNDMMTVDKGQLKKEGFITVVK